jgi:hypothetical protein
MLRKRNTDSAITAGPHCSGASGTSSDTAGLDVAVDVTGAAQECDAVAGWIRFVPLEFVVRDLDLGAYVDMRPLPRLVRPIVGDGGVGLAVPYMELIGPIGVGLAAVSG